MKRFVLLDTTPIPENGGALCLFEYGEAHNLDCREAQGLS